MNETLEYAPQGEYAHEPIKLSEDQRKAIGEDVWDAISASRSDTEGLRDNLDIFERMYEMEPSGRTLPWPGCADLFVPIIPPFLDDVCADLFSRIISPQRIVLCNALDEDPETISKTPRVERYYNNWFSQLYLHRKIYTSLQLGLRDGTCFWDFLWKRQVATIPVLHRTPKMLDDGTKQITVIDGKPEVVYDVIKEMVEQVIYDDVEWSVREMRDVFVFPAWATTTEKAMGIGVKVWLSEGDMRKMIEGGELYPDAVERILTTVAPGQTELSKSVDSTLSYTAGGQIDAGSSDYGSANASGAKTRGPYQCYRVYLHCLALDKNGEPSKNGQPGKHVAYIHEDTHELLGLANYDDWIENNEWALEAVTLMDRPGVLNGYSITERLLSLQLEANAIRNHRLDMVDLFMSPPRYVMEGSKPVDPQRRWGPDAEYTVTDPKGVGFIGEMGQVPQALVQAVQEEQMLVGYADRMFGGGPIMPNEGARKAKQDAMKQAMHQDLRKEMMATNFRWSLQRAVRIINRLKIQHGDDFLEMQDFSIPTRSKFTIPKSDLALNIDLSINGLGGPLDKQARRDTALMKYHLFAGDPVFQDYLAHWKLVRRVWEELDDPAIEDMIGTEEQATQKGEQMKAQVKAEKEKNDQLQMIALQMGKNIPGMAPKQPSGAQRRQQSKAKMKPSGM